MNADELKKLSALAFENGRMDFLIGEAISAMSRAERFLNSREHFRPEHRQEWIDLVDRMQAVLDARKEAPECQHEPFEGKCIHCGAGFANGAPIGESYVCPIHGDLGGENECPRC